MARFESGYIKIDRRCIFGDIGQKGNATLGLWARLIGMALIQESRILWEGKPRDLLPGQVLSGLPELSVSGSVGDIAKVRRDLEFLEKRQSIRQETGSRGRIITICNFETFYPALSAFGRLPADPAAVDRQSEDSLKTVYRQLKEEEEEEEEEKNKKKEKKREGDLSLEIASCIQAWAQTLGKHRIEKDPRLDAHAIGQLIQSNGFEKTKLACLGAAFEEKSDTYDPAKHVSIRRLFKPDVFETFVNLGAQDLAKKQQAGEPNPSVRPLPDDFVPPGPEQANLLRRIAGGLRSVPSSEGGAA